MTPTPTSSPTTTATASSSPTATPSGTPTPTASLTVTQGQIYVNFTGTNVTYQTLYEVGLTDCEWQYNILNTYHDDRTVKVTANHTIFEFRYNGTVADSQVWASWIQYLCGMVRLGD